MLKHNNAYKTIGEVVKILDLKSKKNGKSIINVVGWQGKVSK